jgi:hypothetical protein
MSSPFTSAGDAPAKHTRAQTRKQALLDFNKSVAAAVAGGTLTAATPTLKCPPVAGWGTDDEKDIWTDMQAILQVTPSLRTQPQKTELQLLSEALGEQAGVFLLHTVLEAKKAVFDDKNLHVFGGANVFNMVYIDPNGHIIVIENKGGNSQCGWRTDPVSKQFVQQGTIAYLKAEASVMQGSSDLLAQNVGTTILSRLGNNPPQVTYFGVRAPYKADGTAVYNPEPFFHLQA